MNTLSEFGIIGMGVMGKNLALNLAEKDVAVSIYNRHVPGKEEGIAKKIRDANPHIKLLNPFDDLQAFISSLERPRKILLMIVANAVDYQLQELLTLLEEGDIVIDGGNSYYKDSERREKLTGEKSIYFIGTGISGGEEGARTGPAIMPGGSHEGYLKIQKYFDLIAAKDKDGNPCSSYIGPGGAGHFVKMVHNGIEYAEMQALAEVYYMFRYYLNLSPDKIIDIFEKWKGEGSGSFLMDITVRILSKKEGNELLLDKILDKAEQKGTGGWSASAALEFAVPYGSLTEAVIARFISARKNKRVSLAALHHIDKDEKSKVNISTEQLKKTYDSTRFINHEIGFDLITEASEKYDWNINLSELARIWTNGCIIKSTLMEEIWEALKTESSLLTSPNFVSKLKENKKEFSETVAEGLKHGIAMPVITSALNYYLSITTADSPANLIQAMRDFFGAHTYQRIDASSGEYFHTEW